MKHYSSIFKNLMYTMSILFCMTSCHWFRHEEEHIYDRTVLVYIAAENSLSSFYRDDINEMLEAAGDIPSNSRLIVYLDDIQYPRLISIEKSQEGIATKNTLHQYEKEQDSGDPETLHTAMEWVVKHYPAHSYGLVLWSHGDAWLPAKAPMQRSICIDNNQNSSYSDQGSKMNIADVADALSTFPRMEFILFDACFMQSVEVAYELRHVTKSIIASPAEIPGPGAPYHRIVKPMFETPYNANLIAEEYFKAYNDDDRESSLQNYGVLLSVVDCDLLESFASLTAEMIIKYAPEETELAMDSIQRYCPRPSSSRPNYYDMNGYMLRLITQEADYLRWKSLLNQTVPYAAATPWWYSIYSYQAQEFVDLSTYSGISCYIPQSKSTNLNTLFHTTSWYKVAGWQQLGW